jgi:hypothetical protein
MIKTQKGYIEQITYFWRIRTLDAFKNSSAVKNKLFVVKPYNYNSI